MDRVLYNGKIYVERDRFAQALWMQDGVIRAVGSDDSVLGEAPEGSERIDLGGATVIPGFNDSHLHMRMLGENLKLVQLHNAASLQEVIDRGRQFIEKNAPLPGTLVAGFGWNQDYFTDARRMPNRHDLDQVSTEHPVYFARACGHAVSVNTLALQMAGITSGTPQPEGGQFELGEDGQPNGIFHECASRMFADITPKVTAETIADDIATAMAYAASLGITCVQSNDYNEENRHEMDAALALLRERGGLLTRYYAQNAFTNPGTLAALFEEGYATGRGDDLVRMGPLKLFVDGSLGARTALLRGRYADNDKAQGIQTLSDEVFDELVRIADEAGVSVVTHAIGDGAIDKVLCSYEKVIKGGDNKNRHGVVHVQITDKPMLQRFVDSGVLALIQPIFLHYDMYIVGDRVGPELEETSYAFGSMVRMGIRASYGTDCPVEDLNPFENVYTAVARRDLKCRPEGGYFPAEAVDVQTAIDCYTAESAYSCFAEDRLGRLQPGYLADLVVLDADIFTVPHEDILKIRPVTTYLAGRPVYRR
ncbi:MAG: amidohydrolase family protein [Clostridiales bacterium]|nr:amidohydrolase family protein [Clostridiales bacterium]